MFVARIAFLSLLGVVINQSFAGLFLQPDWALAIVLAALFTHSQHWPWLLLIAALHDLILYWSIWASFPWLCLSLLVLWYVDKELGPAVAPRFACMIASCLPLMYMGGGLMQVLLTCLVCIPMWHIAGKQYA
ncbi:MAG: hypothetical protein Q9M28_00960 [Mariprofundaceae bacterium]|nr:hypothetical protein [Mariprofundaceae bacterium]